jgi:hypothetical protein
MSLKAYSVLSLIVATGLLSGCGILKKRQTDAAASASQVALQPPAPTPVVAPLPTSEPQIVVADQSVPVPEDFEDEAFEKISDKTYKAELETLKREIAAK